MAERIFIQLSGGIGNQLFQYSKYLELKKDFDRLDIWLMSAVLSSGSNTNHHERISELFPQERSVFKSLLTECVFFLRRKMVCGNDYFTYSDAWWSSSGEFDLSRYTGYRNILVRSLFQRKPRADVLHDLKNMYWMVRGSRQSLKGRQRPYSAMHIRLGDYLTDPMALNEIGPLDAAYYRKAYRLLKEREDKLFVVTNGSSNQVRSILDVDLDEEQIFNKQRDIESFHFLVGADSLCICNSTFSIWPAYLSDANLVIAPSRWMKDAATTRDYRTLYLDDWQIISE